MLNQRKLERRKSNQIKSNPCGSKRCNGGGSWSWILEDLHDAIPDPDEAFHGEPLVHHLVHAQVHVGKPHVRVDAFLVFLVQCRERKKSHDTYTRAMVNSFWVKIHGEFFLVKIHGKLELISQSIR
jgi:hypothetical protein